MADSGEHEINEEDTPIIRLGAQRLAKDRIGWGKYRAGMGYEQIATSRGSPYWGFMTGCEGSKFPSAQGLFGGYSCPSYQLMKIKGRSEEHTSELQSLMRNSYAVLCLKKKQYYIVAHMILYMY